MGWQELLKEAAEPFVYPWTGGRKLRTRFQVWTVDGPLPQEYGWYAFRPQGRKATVISPTYPAPEVLRYPVSGYLVGNRLVHDGTVDLKGSDPVFLLEPGLDRFVRVRAGQVFCAGPLIYTGLDMPLGPEPEVLQAFLEQWPDLSSIKGVDPVLHLAYKMECKQREEAERRRAELIRLRQEEEERQRREFMRQQLVERLGDGAGRRAMARVDFTEAARAALAVGGAVLLDERRAGNGERVVRYRVGGVRLECVCDERTLRIVDAGICLTDEETGEKGDTLFTLETLPGVALQAQREGRLVIFRHV